jgi:hypothetical protein
VANFETGFYTLGELPVEDSAGIGFGISWLLAISVVRIERVSEIWTEG